MPIEAELVKERLLRNYPVTHHQLPPAPAKKPDSDESHRRKREFFNAIGRKRTRATSAIQRMSRSRRPPPNWDTVGLEQLRSIKRPKTRTSCEVLDDFGTFFRAHDAMKG
jgi:hypothetical protein